MLMRAAAASQGGGDCFAQVNGAQLAGADNLCCVCGGVVKTQGFGGGIPAQNIGGAQVRPVVQVGPSGSKTDSIAF